MIGFENELNIVDGLIDTLDVKQQDLRTLRIYDIQHVDAQEVRSKLQELGIISGAGAVPSARAEAAKTAASAPPAAPPAAPAVAPPAAPVSEGLVEQPQVVIIASTNSLLVNATPEQHIQIATIISYVDSETLEEAIPYEIYPLENQDPKDLAEVLQKLIQETIKDKEGKIQQIIKKQEDIEIVPDEKTFSLIVYASRKNQEWIKKLITQLDKRRPQVLIDVTLVEITNVDAFNLDLQLVSKLPQMAASGSLTALPLPSGFPSVSSVSNTVKELTSNPGGTGLQGFYADSHIQALLTAMESKAYGRVLAKPKILVNDGESGAIKTTNTTNVQVLGTVPATQYSGAVQTTSYTAYTAGITLTIKPNISEGDLLLLDVKMDRTDFVAGAAANYPPNSRGSNVATVVTVPNDRTIILGGMMTLNQTKGVSKIPLLGDIPIVGVLFRSTTSGTTPGTTDSKLYIFVKANILRPQEMLGKLKLPELEGISDRSKKAFEKSEDKFQSYESLPGIKPKPQYPAKVLEEE
jgi:general secretion pathway protein D